MLVPVAVALPGDLSRCPRWSCSPLAVPVAKLLLAASPRRRLAVGRAGPRAASAAPDPVAAHRVLATVTLGVIGLALGAVAVLGPVAASRRAPGAASSTTVAPAPDPTPRGNRWTARPYCDA